VRRVPIDPERFWTKVSAVEEGPLGCWPWLGALARPDGRALLHDPDLGRPTQAARIAWQLSHAPLPDGLQVLHLCDHPWCVRPTHLVLGSQAANMADRVRKQWVRTSSRRRYAQAAPDDVYRNATNVRARHRKLAAAAGQQLALF
jgi:HNH endonuclease